MMNIRMINLCLFALTYLVVAKASLYDRDVHVQTFTEKEVFDQSVLQSDGVWFVQFCKNDNEKCQKSVPIFSKTAEITKGFFHLAMVDMESEGGQAIANDYSTAKLPAHYIFSPESKPKKYTGDLDVSQKLLQALMDETVNIFQHRNGAQMNMNENKESSSSSSKSSVKDLVVDATESSYDEVVLNNPNVVLVAFVAPWCGYCKKLEPEWTEAAQRLEKEAVTVVRVDATAQEKLAGIYGVKGFPTIKYFPGGPNKTHDMAQDLPVQREAGPIVEFALKMVDQTGVPRKIDEMISQEVFEETCNGKNKICVLAVLPHILDSGANGRNKYLETLSAVQKVFRSGGAYQFLWFEGGNMQLKLESTLELTFGYPAIVAVSLDRGAYSVLRGSFKEAGISSFLNGVITGRQPTIKMNGELPTVQTSEPWDGEDGSAIEEEEMSLDEIMGWGDDDDDKDGGEL
eukprot:CAMPEP_0194131032 /NCGR_PEP_ID=MMETSP0152-20130528/1882_1 /TAXON_ID=1049557 /ORGANISM="Thalassiothrix antarctica, Strain L6-D1" /LENGTH=457 /DNA_ID=CAMNT_0038825685 /DNA_START=27 /DNA_END=1400 /DNA_ORIENTATION=+